MKWLIFGAKHFIMNIFKMIRETIIPVKRHHKEARYMSIVK